MSKGIVANPNPGLHPENLRPCKPGETHNPAWHYANAQGTYENINYGQVLTLKGSFPFATSGHPTGANFGFCDGAVRFISNTIDGTVYSKIITPAGSKLPVPFKQLPVSQDSFAQ